MTMLERKKWASIAVSTGAIALLAVLAGCRVGPRYHAPRAAGRYGSQL